MITYRKASPGDRDAIFAILKSHNLPTADIPDDLQNFLVAVNEKQVAGCVGLEIYGTEALVRSLAVDSLIQHQGAGRELLNRITTYARAMNVHTLHLLTTSAKGYFLSHGFREEGREKSPERIITTKEFSELCPSTAVYMVRNVDAIDFLQVP